MSSADSLDRIIEEAVVEAVAAQAELPTEQVSFDATIGDEGLGLDSLDQTELKMEIEEEINHRAASYEALKAFHHGEEFKLPDGMFRKGSKRKHHFFGKSGSDHAVDSQLERVISGRTTVRELIHFVHDAVTDILSHKHEVDSEE